MYKIDLMDSFFLPFWLLHFFLSYHELWTVASRQVHKKKKSGKKTSSSSSSTSLHGTVCHYYSPRIADVRIWSSPNLYALFFCILRRGYKFLLKISLSCLQFFFFAFFSHLYFYHSTESTYLYNRWYSVAYNMMMRS